MIELRRQLEVNVVGQVAVTQAFLPQLREARGRIVFVGSIAGRSALPFLGPYAAHGRTSVGTYKQPTSALRAEVAATVRDALLTGGSIDTLLSYSESTAGRDDVRVLLELLRRLPPGSPRRTHLVAHLEALENGD